ncbi:DNA repair metallo-beta-lactamase-domain-containing protein [Rhodocollybia butyracea]|uniref:DNA repair metallo-beta-lactamase-domain-containing protein n=1 Tax=Rhodocollybia butyracea TaxID=206335 RepID=A0A9P5PUX0_9AGAR|nr:DNA repair metallo-beta-lactamase-domain-containing protein [Rhodocollybia butyracea]
MSSHKENEAWKEASKAEDRSSTFRSSKSSDSRRKAPFYKVLQGMPIAVDAFRYGAIPGVTAYFLTHAHSDHYTSLSSSWTNGPIYCSQVTSNLIQHMLRVPSEWVRPLPMDTPTEIPDTGGVRVTLIEANHCPGSCLFLFEGKQTVDAGDSVYKSSYVGKEKMWRYLHCGDFRASPAHVNHPSVKGKKIDHVYLDTTYLDPKYTFPSQPQVISACADLAKRIQDGDSLSANNARSGTMSTWVTRDVKGKQKADDINKQLLLDSLVLINIFYRTYSIGKERIVKAIAESVHSKIFCDSRKSALLRCQDDPDLHALITRNPSEAQVHIVPLGNVTLDKLKEYVDAVNKKGKIPWTRVVGFRPTGWTYSPPTGSDLSISSPTDTLISRAKRTTFTYSDLHLGRGSASFSTSSKPGSLSSTGQAQVQVYPVPYSEHSSFFELTCFALSLEWGKMIATVNVGSEASRGKMAKWVEKWEKERKKLKNDGKEYMVPSRMHDYW